MEKIRHIEKYTNDKFRSYELDICYPVAWGRDGIEARLASLCAEAEDAVDSRLTTSSSFRTARSIATACRSRRCWRCRRSISIWWARACALRPGWWWRRARHARCITSRCWAATARRLCIPISPWKQWRRLHRRLPGETRRQEGDQELHQGHRQGSAQGHVQDGHLDLHVLYRGADLRGGRLAAGLRGQVLHRHRRRQVEGIGVFEVAEEAMRLHRQAFGDDPVLASMLDAGGEYAWRVRGEEHMWTPDAIAKLQHATRSNSAPDLQGVRPHHQRPEPAPDDAARPVRIQAGRPAGAARRGGAGEGDRQALRHRRHVAGLHLHRGAYRRSPSP